MKTIFYVLTMCLLIISCSTTQEEPAKSSVEIIEDRIEKQEDYRQFVLDNSAALSAEWVDTETLKLTFDPDKFGKNDENIQDKVISYVISDALAEKGYEYTGYPICVKIYYPDGSFVSKSCVKDKN